MLWLCSWSFDVSLAIVKLVAAVVIVYQISGVEVVVLPLRRILVLQKFGCVSLHWFALPSLAVFYRHRILYYL
jgi:hypothetical protein